LDENTVPLFVVFQAKCLLLVSFTLMRGKNLNDCVKINSDSVGKSPSFAIPITTASTTSVPFTTMEAFGAFDLWLLERALFGRSVASRVLAGVDALLARS
jgi:hypothetical protein